MNARLARENETLRKDGGSKSEAMQGSLDRECWVNEKVETSYECWTTAHPRNEDAIVFFVALRSNALALSDKDPKSLKLNKMIWATCE